jgi:hypothetical protein
VADKQTHTVGTCPCGEPITVGSRYSISTTGPTTIKRVCPGYGCNRVNEVVIRASVNVERAGWHIRDCFCGSSIYLRSDYAGPGFEGGYRALIDYDTDYVNRTVKYGCRRCGCKWSFRIRFTKRDKDGGRRRNAVHAVIRCKACRANPETDREIVKAEGTA